MFGSLITHHQIEHDCHQLQCLQSVLISGLRSIIRCDPSEVRRIHNERSQAEAVMVVLGYCPHLGSTEEPRLLYFGGRLRGPFTAIVDKVVLLLLGINNMADAVCVLTGSVLLDVSLSVERDTVTLCWCLREKWTSHLKQSSAAQLQIKLKKKHDSVVLLPLPAHHLLPGCLRCFCGRKYTFIVVGASQ